MTVGLIIGKFLPPHAGHLYLAERAAAECDELHLCLLAAAPHEEPIMPAWLRHLWLAELLPDAVVTSSISDHPIDYADPAVYDLWVDEIRRTTGRASFDVLFTSEPAYGDETARRLGARHVLVDPERRMVPISGFVIRANPWSHWEFVPPPIRGHYARRVLLTGAESTGTTSMATALADRFATTLVPEYGREYSVPKDRRAEPWSAVEFLDIGLTHQAREDAAACEANRLLFCDTDALATAVWHERYLGCFGSTVAAASWSDRYDLVLLTDADFPWTDDGTRNSAEVRRRMQDRLIAELTGRGRPFLMLSGSPAERMVIAERVILDRLGLRP
jgi:HTH-type transcriptional regulator, transcriptional repressor of NAD biosynthesis genes